MPHCCDWWLVETFCNHCVVETRKPQNQISYMFILFHSFVCTWNIESAKNGDEDFVTLFHHSCQKKATNKKQWVNIISRDVIQINMHLVNTAGWLQDCTNFLWFTPLLPSQECSKVFSPACPLHASTYGSPLLFFYRCLPASVILPGRL